MLAGVFVSLGLVRLALLLLPFRYISPGLGTHSAETAMDDTGSLPVVRRIGWAVEAAARYTPWDSKCLVQAVVAQHLLRRRGIKSTLYLGVAKDPVEGLKAHAWLRVGRQTVTGGGGQSYTVVSTFAA